MEGPDLTLALQGIRELFVKIDRIYSIEHSVGSFLVNTQTFGMWAFTYAFHPGYASGKGSPRVRVGDGIAVLEGAPVKTAWHQRFAS